MLKFLRKYNKWILVIGGSLLMVAFLLPQALQQLGANPARATYLRIDGRKISAERAYLAAREFAALDTLPTAGAGSGGLPLAVGIQSADHWLLLSDLAERSGYVGDQRDGNAFFADAVRQLFIQLLYQSGRGWMLNQPEMAQMIDMTVAQAEANEPDIRARANLTEEQFDMALAKFRGVMRMMDARTAAGRLSRPRIVAEAQRRFDEAEIDYVFLDAESRMETVAEPTQEELEAHFQAYKDERPGEGEYGFGYLLPPRVKVEWLELDREQIAQAVRPDEVEVQDRLRQYREENTDTPEDQAYQTVSDQVRAEAVEEVMRLARQAVQLEVDAAQRSLPTEGDYLVLPPDYAEQRPTLEELADAIVERVEQDPRLRIRMPRPRIERREEWLTEAELAALEGIGQSFLPRGSRPVPFASMAMGVREIAGPNFLGLQEGVLQARPLQGRAAGSQYYFRILAARDESAPESVEDIRERVMADLKRLRAYEALKGQRDELLARAIALGLEAVAESASGSEAGPVSAEDEVQVQSTTVTRAAARAPELNAEAFRDAVIDMAENLDPTAPVDGVDPLARTLAMGIDESLGVAVARITGWRPLSLERYRTVDRGVARQIIVEQAQGDESAPFSFESLVERLNVEYPGRSGQDAESADAEGEGEEAPQQT